MHRGEHNYGVNCIMVMLVQLNRIPGVCFYGGKSA